MMKKYIAVLAAFGIVAAAFATGCSSKNETAETTTESQTETQSEEVTSETAEVSDEVTKIGESIDNTSPNYDLSKAENISETGKVTLKNDTGMDITDISYVGEVANEDEPLTFTYDNMTMGNVFEKDSEAEMIYPESYHTDDDEETVIEFNSLSLNVTFDGDEAAVLHSFEVEDEVEEVSLCYEDEVLYLTYTDKDGNEVSTKEDELAFNESSDVDAETSAVAAQKNNSSDDEKSQDNADDNSSSNGSGDTKSEEAKQTEAPAAAETAAPAEPEQKATEKPAENAGGGNDNAGNDNGGNDADPNGGCLGDEGLFY